MGPDVCAEQRAPQHHSRDSISAHHSSLFDRYLRDNMYVLLWKLKPSGASRAVTEALLHARPRAGHRADAGCDSRSWLFSRSDVK